MMRTSVNSESNALYQEALATFRGLLDEARAAGDPERIALSSKPASRSSKCDSRMYRCRGRHTGAVWLSCPIASSSGMAQDFVCTSDGATNALLRAIGPRACSTRDIGTDAPMKLQAVYRVTVYV